MSLKMNIDLSNTEYYCSTTVVRRKHYNIEHHLRYFDFNPRMLG
jgi:hypothetical protein